ncbi:hypothetical protein K439DRAFT_1615237 [Ramaria rubella]|nr:hypothetical protein K439DRAFT_1615237 [Ramaria rubella]
MVGLVYNSFIQQVTSHLDLGVSRIVNLEPNDEQISVTKENRLQCIYLVSHYHLSRQIKLQSEAFFEILTGVCAKIPEPEPILEKDITEEEEMDGEMETDLEDDIEKSIPPALNGARKPSDQERKALECLNNLFLTIDEARDGGRFRIGCFIRGSRKPKITLARTLATVGKVARDRKLIASKGLEKKTEMGKLRWACCGVLLVGRGYLVPDAGQVQALMEFCDATADDMTKAKCIGALECLAQNPEAIEANKVHLATFNPPFLLNSFKDIFTLVHIHSLPSGSALIDINSHEAMTSDRQGGWVNTLANALPTSRKLVRGIDRRKPVGVELRGRGNETNLTTFIKYRRALKLTSRCAEDI